MTIAEEILRNLGGGKQRGDNPLTYYDMPKGKGPVWLSQVILNAPLRQYFIKKVKAPLMKVLILVANRLPPVTKENTHYKNTHTLIDIFDKFFEHFWRLDPDREKMFRGAFKIFLAEIEHDILYRDPFNWFIEEIIKAILRGDWEERTNGHPIPYWWREKGEYGGKYSIIRILQDKKRLEALLGADWKLKGETK